MTLSISTGGVLCGTDDSLAISTGGVLCIVDVNLVEDIEITPEIADRIYRILVNYADAEPTQRKAFQHHMSDTGTGLGQEEFRLTHETFRGRYGVACFFLDGNEWLVTATRDDESANTQEKVDATNLELALLKDIVLTE